MSFILKALKKVEDEKAARKEGATGIAGQILSGDTDRAKRRNWLLPATAAGFVLLSGLGIYFWGADSPAPPEKAIVATAPADVVPPPAAAGKREGAEAPTKALADSTREVKEREAADALTKELADSTREAREIIAVNRRTADALKNTAESLQYTAVALEGKVVFPPEILVAACEKKATDEVVEKEKVVEEKVAEVRSDYIPWPVPSRLKSAPVPPSKPADGGATASSTSVSTSESKWGYLLPGYVAPAELLVTEIYYSLDVQDRMAVVNDLPVMEGVMVDGARVDRIFRDRIRFVVDGKYKEILLPGAPE